MESSLTMLAVPLSQAELAVLSERSSNMGLSLGDYARRKLLGADPVEKDAALSRQLEVLVRKVELIYQISYFYGRKLAVHPAEFHAFVAALKQRLDERGLPGSADTAGS